MTDQIGSEAWRGQSPWWPLVDDPVPGARWLLWSWLIPVLVLLCHLIPAAALRVPESWWPWWQDLLHHIARLHLHHDPTHPQWWPGQLWTYAIIHREIPGLLLHLAAWWLLAPPLERGLGPLALALWLALIVPLGVSLHLVAVQPVPALGLAPTTIALWGGLGALHAVTRRRFLVVTAVLISAEAVRLGWLVSVLPSPPGMPQVGSGFFVLHIPATALMLLGGYVIAQTLSQWLPRRPHGDSTQALPGPR